ncbi:hypothetical protein PR202_gb23280 [Eleusine coracana subsp. coracana]|uniref:PHD-type domain-containing protein n=1 Tax=Eleusine coracana subsp. coracana TaxID=191504 RepID=A0AAV5FJ14_ELECO|nr:hypothetical protein PR202_gb23280 [Eleusine coracana subsp. coracana]
MHSSKENSSGCSVDSSDCSVHKSSVGNENCSTEAEDEMQVPQKSKYSPNDSRPHIEEGSCRSPCGAVGEDEPPILKQLSVRASRGVKNRKGSVSLNRIKRLENFSNRSACNFGNDEGNAVEAHEVCVLCGYGGGAMARALKHKKVLKSLLKGLTISTRAKRYTDSFETMSSECTSLRNPTDKAHEDNIISTKNIADNSWISVNHNSCLRGRRNLQWVHVVCGLWTPGTKCPNATTMGTFDVSGALPAKRNTVSSVHACSLCSRTGGSFIKCQDLNCPVLFHPWCGHQRV